MSNWAPSGFVLAGLLLKLYRAVVLILYGNLSQVVTCVDWLMVVEGCSVDWLIMVEVCSEF